LDGYPTDRLGRWLRPSLTLVEEDWTVEANVPYREWMRAPKAPRPMIWIGSSIGCRPTSNDSLELPLRWELGETDATRTRARNG